MAATKKKVKPAWMATQARYAAVHERMEIVRRLLARGLGEEAIVQACLRDPIFDYDSDHAPPPEQRPALPKEVAHVRGKGWRVWRQMCAACLAPVHPYAIGSIALERKCRECSCPLIDEDSRVIAERRGLSLDDIRAYIHRVRKRVRSVELDEGDELRAARERLLEAVRMAFENGNPGIAVRAQRELSRMLGLKRRMSEEAVGGDLGERLAKQLEAMTDMTRVMGGMGDIDPRVTARDEGDQQ